MKWFLPVFFAVLVHAGAMHAQEIDALTNAVVGEWIKDGRLTLVLSADGNVSSEKGSNGSWKWLSREERKFYVSEGREFLSYKVTLSEDGNTAVGGVTGNGADQRRVGMAVKLFKSDALTKLLLTDWKTTGDTITFHPDGTYKGIKGTRGTWKWENRETRTFQMTGLGGMLSFTMTLAPDGNSATGKVSGGDPAKVGNVVDYVRVDAPAPASQVAGIPTLNGPPVTKPTDAKAPMDPAKPPPAAAPIAVTPPASEPKELSVTGKWLAEQDPQWQASYSREVIETFNSGIADLKKQFMASLDVQMAQFAREAKLDEAVQVRSERDRVAGGGDIMAGGDAGALPALQGLRASYAKKWNVLVEERAAKARSLHDRYDGILNQFQIRLTQNQRIDEALEIKSKREQISATWLKDLPAAKPVSAPPAGPVPGPVPGAAPSAAAPPTPPKGAPPEATYFNGRWFHVYLEKVSWTAASKKCTALGGHLVIVPDEATQEVIAKLGNGRPLWLGASDERSEGRWKWVDGTAVKFTAWQSGEPAGGKRENFMQGRGSKSEWIDAVDADAGCAGYICEWKAK